MIYEQQQQLQQQQQQQQEMPMLTLSVGGVSFSLTPTTSAVSISPNTTTTTNHTAPLSVRFFHPVGEGQESSSVQQRQQQNDDDESIYCMALESFTGTLRIQVKKSMRQASLVEPAPIAATATSTTATTTPSTSATTASKTVQGEEQQQQQHREALSLVVTSIAEERRTSAESPRVVAKVTAKTCGGSFSEDTTCSAATAVAVSSSASSWLGQEKKKDGIVSTLEEPTTADSSPMADDHDADITAISTTKGTVVTTGTNATAMSASMPSWSGPDKQPDHCSLKRISLQPDETRNDNSLFKRQKCSSSQFQLDDENDDDDVYEDDSNDHRQQSSALLAQEDLTQTQYSSQVVELHEHADDEEDEHHDAYSPNLLETPPPPPPNDETNNTIHDDANGGGDTHQASLSSNSQCLRTILENNHSRDSSTTTYSAFCSTSRTNASARSTNEASSARNASSILDDTQDDSEEEEEEEEDGSAEMDQEQEGNNDIANVTETKIMSREEDPDEVDPTMNALADSPHTAPSDNSPQHSIVSRSPLQQQAISNLALALPVTTIQEASSPCPRWGHTMTDLGDGRLLVYGGQVLDTKTSEFAKTLNDLHVYNIKENKWYIARVNGGANSCGDTDVVGGLPRQWHTATFLPDRHLLICLGGEAANPKTGKAKAMDPVMVLDTKLMVFYPPVVSGDIPNGRSGHTTCVLVQSPNNGTARHTEELVVFGGIRGNKWLNSVSLLNTQTWVWRTPRLQGMAPRPRSYHSATAISNRIVIFGGNNAEQSFNTVHVLEQSLDNDGNTAWRWTHPSVRGHPPKPRTGHSATLLADQKTICFYGGWDLFSDEDGDDEEFIFQDCFLLDTEKWEWKPGPVIENDSCRRCEDEGHTTTSTLDTKRVGHTSVLLTVSETDNAISQKVLIFGGRAPGDRFACDFKSLHPIL